MPTQVTRPGIAHLGITHLGIAHLGITRHAVVTLKLGLWLIVSCKLNLRFLLDRLQFTCLWFDWSDHSEGRYKQVT